MSRFMEEELQWLENIGVRLTGSDANNQLINRVEEQLQDIGLKVESDTYKFDKWDVDTAVESVHLSVGGEDISVASVFPYSGHTRGERLEAELVAMRGPIHFWSSAKGKIAVVRVSADAIDMSRLVDTWFDAPRWPHQHVPLLNSTLASLDLKKAAAAGVLGVVLAWEDCPVEEIAQQYLPFTFPYLDIPAFYVAGEAARRAVHAATQGKTARFQLTATITKEIETRTVWASVPGKEKPDETILCITHSDGMNSVEENGHIAHVQFAKDLVANPPSRTVVFVLTTGHLRIPAFSSHGQATSRWLDDHPEMWKGGPGQKRAVFGLGLEHFGAREFSARTSGTTDLVPTGRNEPELLYATTEEVAGFCKEYWNTADPQNRRISRPSALIHFGEGEPLLKELIPSLSLVTLPVYLLSLKQDDYVDRKLMARQMDDFMAILRHADTTPSDGFGKVVAPSVFAKARTAASLMGSLMFDHSS